MISGLKYAVVYVTITDMKLYIYRVMHCLVISSLKYAVVYVTVTDMKLCSYWFMNCLVISGLKYAHVCVTVTDMKYLAVKVFGSALWLILQTAEW